MNVRFVFVWLTVVSAGCGTLVRAASPFADPSADRDALPVVPPGFEISFFAREPLVRQPCSLAFDSRGRLCVGMGPQYRNPQPETPGDSVVLVLDTDVDGQADSVKTFATGFNAIQSLAWRGRDLWVANAPDLTVVRDLDGDDEADEYVRVYTDLGNLEHGLHGLNWAPDGRLYMSKGNSKGLTQPGRVAPKPFRELWGVTAPPGTPDFPPPRSFTKDQYRKAYHDPQDDWGREGGVLRCDQFGANLEIVSRGLRNPWDMTFDTGFNWLGTDNDQTTGDRVFMPFFGAHFGWNHPWSSHWGTEAHLPTAPVSGPLFEGSGTGVVFGDSPLFPPSYRGVFFINDWLRKTTFVWRPRWEGALQKPDGGDWEPFVRGGSSLFRPTDLEVGPDGALWILGWSAGYGAEYQDGQMTSEGRVFRVVSNSSPGALWRTPKRSKPLAQWTVSELVEGFAGPLPVWRMDAQDELVRRGAAVKGELLAMLERSGLSEAHQTWIAWTVGRMAPFDSSVDQWFATKMADSGATLNLRVQSLRILADRLRPAGGNRELPVGVVDILSSQETRLRFEAVQAIGQARQVSAVPRLLDALAAESDPATFYAGWQTLRGLVDVAGLKTLLADSRAGVRTAALLALLELGALMESNVQPLVRDPEPMVRNLAAQWLEKTRAGVDSAVVRGRPLKAVESVEANSDSEPRVGLARSISARSKASYRLVAAGLRAGANPYTDRGYRLVQIPSTLVGLDFIQTANDDDGSSGDSWLSFEAIMPVRVHVAFDTRSASLPTWLRKRFQSSDQQIRADHWNFQLFSAEFPSGRIELGGNTDDGREGGKGNYLVVLEPLPLAVPALPTSVDAALALVNQGDPVRGEWLFHARGGVACFNCHRVGDHGNRFGPDLATLGGRATARHVIQSILEPNAVITEGFNQHLVETADAEYSGILLEESGLSLTLGLANGGRPVLSKSKITRRTTLPGSAMPSFDAVLNPQNVADLTAYLLAQTAVSAQAPTKVRAGEPAVAADASLLAEGFRYEEREDRLVIADSGQTIAEFVFRDERIRRPYFANVRVPGGTMVTRNHPPISGLDATDHDTMHPGIWLGFGDVSGVDFWRNRGRIEHVRFVEPPTVREGSLTFATEDRLRAPTGDAVAMMTNRFTLSSHTNAWLLVWGTAFFAAQGDFTFGDQEEMGFGARVAAVITEKNGGVITSSTGLRTAAETWGQSADWCDYSGIVDGSPVGITLLSDPRNFRPSWWHNRDYGVFVANPFGRAALKQGKPSLVTVKRGETFRLRFGAVLHRGPGYQPGAAFESFRRLPIP